LTVTNSTISGNGSDSGGGIYNDLNTNTVTVTNSTISSNDSIGGGGIYTYGTMNVTNTTLSGNSASSNGGGIANAGALTLTNSTLFGNLAGTSGGGIYTYAGGTVTAKNTIVANSPSGGNCVGTITGSTNNLSSDSSCGFSLLNTDPMLGLLASNGGPTETHLPLLGSPVVDAGNGTVCADPATVNNLDQRGEARPFDGNGDSVPLCDIGAVERRIQATTLSIDAQSGFESNTETITFTVTRGGPIDASSTVDFTTIDVTATAGSDYVTTNGTLTFGSGVATQPIVVTLRGDTVVEGSETFFVSLTNPTNAVITENQGQGTIVNSTVTLNSPVNNAFTKDNTPTVSWEAIGAAVEYRLQIDDNSNFASPIVDLTMTATSYTPTSALGDAKYYWRVRARNAAGNWGGWCTRRAVTVDTTPPTRPTLLFPVNGATTTDSTPALKWKAVSGATKYRLQVDDNSNFASPIIDRNQTSTSYTSSTALSDRKYYWRVRAQDKAGNWSAWSTRWSFIVNAVPIAPPTLIPTNTPRPTLAPTQAPTMIPTNMPTVTPTETQVPTEITPLLQTVESDNPLVVQSGVWGLYGEPATSGGTYLLSSTLTDTLELAFMGSEVAVVYIKHPSVGSFAIEVDGTVMQIVNSVALEAVYDAEATISGLAYGQHVVRVYPVAGVVAIDAFKVEMALQVLVPTATPVPTNIPTVVPVETLVPTETPVPTDVPTETPVPTDVPTEVPTETPIPTEAPMLTPVPTDMPTEVPVEVEPPAETTEEPAS
jgi:hypothetical protein